MKTIYKNLKDYNDYINIIPLADLHIGAPECKMDYIRKMIFDLVNDKHSFVVLNGDIVDMALPGTVGNQYTATMTPDNQIKAAIELFQPLSDVGRIICVLNGNHEERLLKSSGVSVASQIAKALGIPTAYSDTTALLFLDVGDISYTVYVTHGSGCTCREVSSKINKGLELYEQVGNILDYNMKDTGAGNGALAEEIASRIASVLKDTPIENVIEMYMEDGDVTMDGERVGRKIAPTISRIQARKR